MTNRLTLPDFALGIYEPRTAQPHLGMSIEMRMPALLPAPQHSYRPPLFIYGSYYRLVVHSGQRAGETLLALHPEAKEAGGHKMQEVGARLSPDTWPICTKIEFREDYCAGLPGLIKRIYEYHMVNGVVPSTGKKLAYDAVAHPTTGVIVVHLPEILYPFSE